MNGWSSPLFSSVVDGQLVCDALLTFEGVPVHLGLLQRAHLLLLPSDTTQDAGHSCWTLHTGTRRRAAEDPNQGPEELKPGPDLKPGRLKSGPGDLKPGPEELKPAETSIRGAQTRTKRPETSIS